MSAINPQQNSFFVPQQPVESLLSVDTLTAGSPIFARYRARARWLRHGDKSLKRQEYRAIFVLLALMVGIIVVIAIITPPRFGLAEIARYSDMGGAVAGIAFLGSLPLGLLFEVIAVVVAPNIIKRDAQFDLLRLTSLSKRGIVVSYHAILRLVLWRGTNVIFALRIASIVVLLIVLTCSNYVNWNMYYGYPPSYYQSSEQTPIRVALWLAGAANIALYGAIIAFEARRRLNAVTARAVVITLLPDNGIPKLFLGLLSVFSQWVILAVGYGIWFYLLLRLSIWNFDIDLIATNLIAYLFAAVAGGILAVLSYGLNHSLQNHALRRAEQVIFTEVKI